MAKLGSSHLDGISRCPRCSVAIPTMERLWQSPQLVARATPGATYMWSTYRCTTCGGVVLARGEPDKNNAHAEVTEIIPASKEAHGDLPETARRFLQQALETLHAPDAAAVMAGSAVDAMLKELGYTDGSVYARIKQAVDDHKLTEGMGSWAQEVRLGSNRPRHADAEHPHVSPDEAKQAVEFTEALGYFLFVLTKSVERGTAAAKQASA